MPITFDDFRVKYSMTLAMCQSVKSDTNGLWKVPTTNITWLQLEIEIEDLKEKLLFMKNQEEEVNGLQTR